MFGLLWLAEGVLESISTHLQVHTGTWLEMQLIAVDAILCIAS